MTPADFYLRAENRSSPELWTERWPLVGSHLLGRNSRCDLHVPVDPRISRVNLRVDLVGRQLRIMAMPSLRNPVYYKGEPVVEAVLDPGEHFVIGSTVFVFESTGLPNVDRSVEHAVEEFTFSNEDLAKVQYRDADRKIDVLSHLPELILKGSENELQTRLVNLLLAGASRAEGAGLVCLNGDGESQLLSWARRNELGGTLPVSQRLVQEALKRQEHVVLHLWERDRASSDFTAHQEYDWAICAPVPGFGEDRWGLYLAGRSDRALVESTHRSESAATAALQADAKFTGLVAEIVGAVRKQRLLERRQAGLRQFLPPSVVAALGDELDPELLAPRQGQVVAMFCDLRGFSRHAEALKDDLPRLLERVSQALGVMTRCISSYGGVIGDFQGDAALGFWGWPVETSMDSLNACRAALAIRSEFWRMSQTPDHPLADFRIGIGMALGNAVAGRIGTGEHFAFTAFGPDVNLASRLESLSKPLRVPIVINEMLELAIRNTLPATEGRTRQLAMLLPYGFSTPARVYELLPPVGDDNAITEDHRRKYEQAVEHFIKGEWDLAYSLLRSLPAHDEAQDFLMLQITQHNRVAPADWNGVVRMAGK